MTSIVPRMWRQSYKNINPCSTRSKRTHSERIFVDSSGRKGFRYNDSVIKFGRNVNGWEAKTLRFIKQSTSIPVPDVIAEGPHALEMNYIDGENLRDCWPQFSDGEKQRIAEQMGRILAQLRGLKGSYIGAINRGPAEDNRRSSYRGGPFDSENDWNQFLLGNMIRQTPALYRYALQQKFKTNHQVVFTHADLGLRNILVKNGHIVGLLDWESSGWYPEHWEYVKFCTASTSEPTYHKLGPVMFPTTYPDELVTDTFYSRFVF
ncbi:hypothetical protein GJ744_006485 [Endocarpon pusillum]|uniref:Aminoglycoside phosphotransferase domain-containing protein n=1 Tax=Endocarpon pusillum TaxID=364733 RepID=A0A8H7AVE5_9EURO|nr:hypothetical protein GJ744_006485 [Endocarpon pusillum]